MKHKNIEFSWRIICQTDKLVYFIFKQFFFNFRFYRLVSVSYSFGLLKYIWIFFGNALEKWDKLLKFNPLAMFICKKESPSSYSFQLKLPSGSTRWHTQGWLTNYILWENGDSETQGVKCGRWHLSNTAGLDRQGVKFRQRSGNRERRIVSLG